MNTLSVKSLLDGRKGKIMMMSEQLQLSSDTGL